MTKTDQDSSLSTRDAGEPVDSPQLPCIVCGEIPKGAFGSQTRDNQPSDATVFTSYGHYGSSFFDDMDGSQIEINICDAHLKAHRNRIGYRKPPTRQRSPLLPFTRSRKDQSS